MKSSISYAVKSILGFVLGSVVIAFTLTQCVKARAESVHAFALSSGCADTAGIYIPAPSGSSNLNNVNFAQSHFIRVCNEVTVSGRVSWSSVITLGNTATLVFPIPIASVLDQANTYGIYNFRQAGVGVVPVTAQFVSNPGGNMQIDFVPTKTGSGTLFYTFTYTIN